MAFHVGQKVVCVYAFSREKALYPFINYPKQGGVFTISEFDGCGGLRFSEVPNAAYDVGYGPQVPSFYPPRFRPVVERKTDISALQALLNTKSIDELVS